MFPTAEVLLQAWESAGASAPSDRAASLLVSLGSVPVHAEPGELTVGECDARLMALRRSLFGDPLELIANCPQCQTEVELTLRLSDLQPPVREGPSGPITVEADGYTFRCRIPRNEDISAIANRGSEATLADLLARCIIEASGPAGAPAISPELPSAVVDSVLAALAAADPGALTALRVRCFCGCEWAAELDIRDVIWNDLTEWVGRTLTEVHLLAHGYGWSESDILGMSGWRRRWYLEALGW